MGTRTDCCASAGRLVARVSVVALFASWMLGPVPSHGADYMTQTLGTDLDEPADLVIESPQVLSETLLNSGEVLIEAAAQLRNLAHATWAVARMTARERVADLTQKDAGFALWFSGLSLPSQVTSPTNSLYTIVTGADLAAARTDLQSGSMLFATAELAGTGAQALTNALQVVSPRIVSETSLANGQVLIELTADVRNDGGIVYSNIAVHLDYALGSVAYRPPLGSSTHGGLLGPLGVTTNLPVYFIVASNEVETARSNVLSGAALTHTGRELWVFVLPPKGIDKETHDVWRWPRESAGGGQTRLVFTNATPLLNSLQPGDLLVEDPHFYRLPTEYAGVNAQPVEQMLPGVLPFEVSSISSSSNEVLIVGRKRLLTEVLRSATFVANAIDAYENPVRDPYNPTLENTYTHEEQTNRNDVAMQVIAQFGPRDGRLADLKGLTSKPIHFNLTNLSQYIRVSGELLFRQSGLKLEIKIRDFEVQRAVTRVDAGAILNMVIEAERGEDTRSKPEEEKSKELIPQDKLPPLNLSLGGVPVVVQPVLSLKVGVEANIPTRLAIPLQSSFLVGMEMGFDRSRVTSTNDGFYYEPFTQFVPLRMSDPSVFDDLSATLEAWAELGLGVQIGIGEQVANLKAGPSLAARLGNTFTLAPLADPWWSMNSGVDLIGRFTMDLSLLGFDPVELVDTEAELHHFDLFHSDAGGPLIELGRRSKHNVRPVSGKDVRWGRLLVGEHWEQLNSGFVLRPTNTTDVVVGGNRSLVRIDSRGSVVWARDLTLGGQVHRGVALPDGAFTVAGFTFGDIWVANFSPDGNRNWVVTLDAGGMILHDLVLGRNAQGAPEYYLVGNVQRGSVTRSDPQVIKLDAAGQVLWARAYNLDGEDDEAHGGTLTADGNLVLGGKTGYAVSPPAIGTPDPANILKTACGLLMKVSSADGALLWANAFPSQWGLDFREVLEAPDGTLYAAGNAGRIVTQNRPSAFFARFTAAGELIDHVTVGEDIDWPDELPNAGSTPYDTVAGLIWTPEGLWASGTTGLGKGTAGFVIGLTEELGVRFYSVFDGANAEQMIDLVDSGNGLVVLGNTLSSYPWGIGDLPVPVLLKLPWEGIMRFHPDSQLQSLFLQPRVYKTSADLDFLVFSRLTIPGGGIQTFVSYSGAVPFAQTNATVTLGETLAPPLVVSNYPTIPIEALDPASVTNYHTWMDYHALTDAQQDPAADLDGDGLPNYLEAYFGRSPWVPEPNAPFALSTGTTNGQVTASLQFNRPAFASGFDVWFESSSDFQSWTTLTNVTQDVQTLDGLLKQVLLRGSRTEPREFFRAAGKPSSNMP